MKNDRNYYRIRGEFKYPFYDRIVYRTFWLVTVNLILKILQPFTKSPFLVRVVSEIDDDGNPHFIKYGFGRVDFLESGYFKRIWSSLYSGRFCERYYK